MSISETTRKAGPFSGNGSTTVFLFTFKVFSQSDLVVTQTDAVGVETILTLTTHYTVALNANQDSNPGGSITLNTAAASGYKVTITSGVAETQLVALTNAGGFYPTVINDALDKITILIQQLKELSGRALRLKVSDAPVDTTLPAPLGSMLIGWNTDGTALANYSAGSVGLTTSNILDGSVTTAKFNAAAVCPSATNVTGTIGPSVTATTQTAGDNSTKIATTAYADAAAAANGAASKIQPITASVGSNALTLTLNATKLDFRSSTLSSGTVNTRTVSSPISVTVSSGSTLGTSNSIAARLAVLAIDNAGTVELAVVNTSGSVILDESNLISTTAEGGAGGADSANVIYSTTTRSSVPFRVVGFIIITQTTAGTWASAPSTIQGIGGTIAAQKLISSGVVPVSGTAIDFMDIPYWVKRITVMFSGINTTSASNYRFQLGTSGGFASSGYVGSTTNIQNANAINSTVYPGGGFDLYNTSATAVLSGTLRVVNISGNTWVADGVFALTTSANGTNFTGGTVTLSGTLDRIRITTIGGVTFGNGSINIILE